MNAPKGSYDKVAPASPPELGEGCAPCPIFADNPRPALLFMVSGVPMGNVLLLENGIGSPSSAWAPTQARPGNNLSLSW